MDKEAILFLTNSELGQASVHLAVAHEFLLRPEYEVHIGSFPALAPCVEDMNTRARFFLSAKKGATFHPLSGNTMRDACIQKMGDMDTFAMHGIGWRAALNAYKSVLIHALTPWPGPEYLTIYNECRDLIRDLQPSMVAVDPFFAPGIDACRMAGCQYIILSPNTVKDHIMQPKLANLWRFPAMCSGYTYPVPLPLIVPNVLLCISLGLTVLRSPGLKELKKYRRENGVEGPVPSMAIQADDKTPVLIPAKSEYEFPTYAPNNIIMCGPILRPWDTLAKEHAGLAQWLANRPTILANLGSHVSFDNKMAREFAEGLAVILKKRPDIQVLWKLKWKPATVVDQTAFESIWEAIRDNRVRITNWLRVEPISILMSGNIKCMIHHGGSNSFHEAIRAGVPQVILPVWFDTYDFANRVEWLKIGVWGNRKTAPAVNGKELGRALVRVLASDKSALLEKNAKRIALQLGPKEGRVVACEKMIELINARKQDQDHHEDAKAEH